MNLFPQFAEGKRGLLAQGFVTFLSAQLGAGEPARDLPAGGGQAGAGGGSAEEGAGKPQVRPGGDGEAREGDTGAAEDSAGRCESPVPSLFGRKASEGPCSRLSSVCTVPGGSTVPSVDQ